MNRIVNSDLSSHQGGHGFKTPVTDALKSTWLQKLVHNTLCQGRLLQKGGMPVCRAEYTRLSVTERRKKEEG